MQFNYISRAEQEGKPLGSDVLGLIKKEKERNVNVESVRCKLHLEKEKRTGVQAYIKTIVRRRSLVRFVYFIYRLNKKR